MTNIKDKSKESAHKRKKAAFPDIFAKISFTCMHTNVYYYWNWKSKCSKR